MAQFNDKRKSEIKSLRKVHREFLSKEFGIEDVDSLDDDVFVEIYNELCSIEEEEFADSDSSERGAIAVEVQDYMAQQMEFEDDENDGVIHEDRERIS